MIKEKSSFVLLALMLWSIFALTPVKAVGPNTQYTGSLEPTRNDFWEIGSTTLGLKYKSANIGVLNVDSCPNCSAGSGIQNLQQGYNAMTTDAQVTLDNAHNMVFFLSNQTTDPNFLVNIDSSSNGLFAVQKSTSAAATTTVFSVNRDGSTAVGIGTSTQAGFTVNATSTILGGTVYTYGGLVVPFLNSTSTTQASFFAGDIGANTRRVPNIYAQNLDAMTILVNGYSTGDLHVAGDIFAYGDEVRIGSGLATSTLNGSGSATSTLQGGLIVSNTAGKGGLQVLSGGINIAGDALFSGKLNNSSVSTSTFSGGISAVGLASSAGLSITGDSLFSGKLVQSLALATSSFAGGLTASSSLAVTGRIVATPDGGCSTTQAGTTTINMAKSNGGCFSFLGDGNIAVEKFLPNQGFRLWVYHDHNGTTVSHSNLSWASATPEYVFYFTNQRATTTTGSIAGTLDLCVLTAGATSTAPQLITVQCSANYGPAQP